MRPEHPWESASLNWFNVIQDQGRIDPKAKYRMWYEAYDIDGWPTGDDTSFCYAESVDGKVWTKPKLGLFSYQGSKQNNILFRQIGSKEKRSRSRVHGTGLFFDPHAPSSARYKAVGQGLFVQPGQRPYKIAGMFSADGLNWTRYPEPICYVFADSQYSGFWDESKRRYMLYGRVAGRGRSIGHSTSTDFTRFESLKLVAQANDDDPPNSDLYNACVIKYPFAPKVYFMLPSLYQHGPDTLDIRLAVSRDGEHWSRPDQTTPYIALGKRGQFDSGSLYMGNGMLRAGDELSLYYSGSPLPHNDVTLDDRIKPTNARLFSRVVTQLDRFVAATAGNKTGTFTTPQLQFTGNTLQLNAKINNTGSIRVGLLDGNGKPVPGHSIDDCLSITGDAHKLAVKWKNGDDIGNHSQKPIRLQVEMSNAQLFSFQFVSGSTKSN